MYLKFIIVAFSLSNLIACGHYQRPQFRSGAGEFTTQSRDPQNSMVKGPFKLFWPVKKVRITQKFKPNRKRPHHGVDLDGKKNDPILSAHEGYVIYAGSGFRGYGKMVIVQYDSEWASLYSHLNAIKVKEGQYVAPRQLIGKMGRTGRASGVHLHFELMKYKLPVDPLPLIQRDQRLVKY